MNAPYYTGKGDQGTSSLFGSPARLDKDNPVFDVLGTLDELNCWLGLCRSLCAGASLESIVYLTKPLEDMQDSLFIIQAQTAGADTDLPTKRLRELESLINRLTEGLPRPESFCLPGASSLGAYFDIARAVARRCERSYWGWAKNEQPAHVSAALTYLNRLSSVLYVLVRFANRQSRAEETPPSYGS